MGVPRLAFFRSLFGLLLVLAGCPSATTGDGGETRDSGSPPVDGGVPADGGGGTQDGGQPSDAGGTPDGGGTLPDGGVALAITTFGVHGSRDSLYVDPAFTKARLSTIAQGGGLRPDPTFTPAVVGDVYASPLYLEAGIDGKD